MNDRLWIVRSLRYYIRQHAMLAGGASISAAVLAAALLTGDALHASLARLSSARLGRIRSAVVLRGGVAPADLADRLQAAGGGAVAPLLNLAGALRVPLPDGGSAVVPQVRIYGCDARFSDLAAGRGGEGDAGQKAGLPVASLAALQGDRVALSRRLADELRDRAPDFAWDEPQAAASPWLQPQLVFRQPSEAAIELPLGADREARQQRARMQPVGIVPDEAFGRFDLRVSQLAPRNLFIDREALAERAAVPGAANLWVTDGAVTDVRNALRRSLLPSDGGLQVAQQGDCARLTSRRLYLAEAHVGIMRRMEPPPVLATYHLADAFETIDATRSTPYGFIGALSPSVGAAPGVVDAGLADDEAYLSPWLAERLQVAVGDHVRIRWRRLGEAGELVPGQAVFRIARVLSREALAEERDWMPEFPGLSGVESCADWDIGLPMDEAALNDPDNEAYWQAYGATPKLFITHEAGRQCFGSVHGDTMVARFGIGAAAVTNGPIWARLAEADPEALGFEIRPLAQEGAAAVAQSTDFRQLFVGMSFFMMVAALMLTALLAQLALDRRIGEIGILKACGMSRRHIRCLVLLESSVVLAAGAVVGGLGGGLLSRGLVAVLNRAWRETVAGTPVWPVFRLAPVLLAAGLVLIFGMLILVWVGRRRLRETIQGLPGMDVPRLPLVRMRSRHDGIGLMRAGLLNLWREPSRSLLTALLLAAGLFLPIAILAMKHDPAAGWLDPAGGAGGFHWRCEPPGALTEADGMAVLAQAWPLAERVGLRERGGDGAECLSLTRAQNPGILGVPVARLAAMGAFGQVDWAQLESPLADGCLPAFTGDRTTLQYGLAARAGVLDGTVYTYPSGRGGTVRVRIVGTLPPRVTILQGSLLVDERVFAQAFPDFAGYRHWLVKPETVADSRPGALLRDGWEVESSADRLRSLAAMENSYLDMFLVLGGLGVVLGVLGLGILLLRNVEARRGELAVLRALGVSRRRLAGYLLVEQMGLMLAGLLGGTLPAVLILLPAVVRLSQTVPVVAMVWLIAAYLGCGAVGTLVAATAALRRPLTRDLSEPMHA